MRQGADMPVIRHIDALLGTAWVWDDEDKPVHVVPLALFWRKGPRSESRFLNLSYGAITRPSDVAKVGSFFANYRDLSVKSGAPIDLLDFALEFFMHAGTAVEILIGHGFLSSDLPLPRLHGSLAAPVGKRPVALDRPRCCPGYHQCKGCA